MNLALDRGVANPLTAGLGPTMGQAGTVSGNCTDVVGNYNGPNALTLTKFYSVKWWASGKINGFWDMDNFSVTRTQPSFAAPSSPAPSDNTALTRGLAATNPNRPYVDSPVFVFELKDIPEMIKKWGEDLAHSKKLITGGGKSLWKDYPRKVGEKYLEWNFGLAPLFSDLGKMVDFAGATDRKIKVLNKLGDPSDSSYSAHVWSDEVETGPWTDYASSIYQEHRRVVSYDVTSRKKWVSTIWRPVSPLPDMGSNANRYRAFKLAYGLDFSPAQVWEAMPWSWLVDWFSNVGDCFNANRNTIPVEHSGSCIMTETRYSKRIDHFLNVGAHDSLSLRLPPYTRVEKLRTVMGSATTWPEFNLPFLTGKQLSILGSLAVTRR